jgi:hypothetical protein
MDASKTRLAFISDYQGEADYQVIGGPMDRRRISVRYLTAEAEAELAKYRTPEGQAERIASAGCVIVNASPGEAVASDVLEAVRARHAEHFESMVALGWGTKHLAPAIDAATWSPDSGYVRIPDEDLAWESDASLAPKAAAGMGMRM